MFKKILIISVLITTPAYADCNPNDDGDCCKSDADCAAYLHPGLCAVIPLNKTAVSNIEKQPFEPSDFCRGEILDKLKEDQRIKKPKCFEFGCEFDEDNG